MKIPSVLKIASILFAFSLAAATASPAQAFKELYSFCSQPSCADGSTPYAALVQGTDGSFYGTTAGTADYGGSVNGTIFKIDAGGHLTTLYTFCSKPDCADGAYPGGLVQGSDGNFYGVTTEGGGGTYCSAGCGTIFKMTPEGALTTLYIFCAYERDCPDGVGPSGTLMQATDGNFYGTTGGGGAGTAGPECNVIGCGTVFRMTPAGKVVPIYSFCSQANCPDGALPIGGLIQGAGGDLYGTTREGGTINDDYCYVVGCGTAFEITLNGELTTLYSFCSLENCADGYFPEAPLVQGTNGNLYGTTLENGSDDSTAFEISADGTFKTLYTFCSLENCADGTTPESALIQGTDGNLYGVTYAGGGRTNPGTAFQLTTAGVLTTLYTFCSQPSCTDGSQPLGALLQATNGSFYGTTVWGGQSTEVCLSEQPGCGTVFSISTGLRPFVETRPTSSKVGTNVFILGNNLAGATSVTFNGTGAAFTVSSDTLIRATVPGDATSGFVRVTTPKEILKSNVEFDVTQ